MTIRLLFSDIHFHTWSYGASVDESGYNTRLLAQYEAALEMVQFAIENGVEYAYFLGDLFHTHGTVPVQALNLAHHMFRSLRTNGIYVRSIYGNHDMASRDGNINALTFIEKHNSEGGVDPAKKDRYSYLGGMHCWRDNGLRVCALPYTTDEDQIKRFLDFAGKTDEKTIVLMHQGVAGIPLASGFILDERLTPAMIPDNVTAFTGHYHFHRVVTPNLTVVGNLTPLNWNDIDQTKGWVTYNDETGEIKQHAQSKAPEFRLAGQDYRGSGNAFVRYNQPVRSEEQAEVRASLIANGALTVEFPEAEAEEGSKERLFSGEQVTLDHMLKAYEQDIDPRRKEVGEEIRGNRYAAATS